MKQVLIKRGKAVIEEVPSPPIDAGHLLVKVQFSCISPGTEITAISRTATPEMVNRLRNNPASLRRLLRTFGRSGFRGVTQVASEKLNQLVEVGYSCAGRILEVGSNIEDLGVGALVACAGAGHANHAEVIAAPRNLTVPIPPKVSLEDACTVALGAIALQGVRRAEVSLGERVGVIGLGFIGLLTVQLLKAAGCSVFGLDPDMERMMQALNMGLDAAPRGEEPLAAALHFSEGHGLDAVVLTAGTKSSEPLRLAMQMTRRKGRISVVGDVGMQIERGAMYAKELDLRISTSYGPGRYDRSYEENGLDYPLAFVRWTENRNMQAYLALLSEGKIRLDVLTKTRLPLAKAEEAYALLRRPSRRPYTVLLTYPAVSSRSLSRTVSLRSVALRRGPIRLALIGAGSFARETHLPNLIARSDLFKIEAVVSRRGSNALALAQSVKARLASTDYGEVLGDPDIEAVLVATRHNLHAELTAAALRAGKHVFVEKPLAIDGEDLLRLRELVERLEESASGCPVVFVGFNRRHSPYALRIKDWIRGRSSPVQMYYRMNAGYLSPEHWVHGPEGGGRLLGEACHIFDLFRYLTGASALSLQSFAVRCPTADVGMTENFTTTINYQDGSVATLLYTARGASSLGKEFLEVHADGRSLLLYDYTRLQGVGCSVGFQTRHQEKGHLEELLRFAEAVRSNCDWRLSCAESFEATQTALEANAQLCRGHPHGKDRLGSIASSEPSLEGARGG